MSVKLYWLVLAVIVAVALASCSWPANPQEAAAKAPNSCLVLAATMREHLRAQGIWAEVVGYQWRDRTHPARTGGHAICAYFYPVGKNQLWSYDAASSYRCRAWRDDAMGIARSAEAERGRTWIEVTEAAFIRDLPDTEILPTPTTPAQP